MQLRVPFLMRFLVVLEPLLGYNVGGIVANVWCDKEVRVEVDTDVEN